MTHRHGKRESSPTAKRGAVAQRIRSAHDAAVNRGQVFDRQTILNRIWGEDCYVDERTVDVHIRWLREKIEENPAKPERILTVRGVGYKFEQPGE